MIKADLLTQLVDAHYASLYCFALSFALNTNDACNLTQQSVYVWAILGHALRDTAKVKTWLFTTLFREFLKGRRHGVHITALADLPPGEEDPKASNVNLAVYHDAQRAVEALQEVDATFRVPLTSFYLEDMPYHAIAAMIAVLIDTVMARLSRGEGSVEGSAFPSRNQTENPFIPSCAKKTS